jgi:glycerophosphoryl diester phosphodiesterase
MSPLIGGTARTFYRSWKQLVLTDIVYKLIALVLLTPLVGGLFRLLVAISGSAVLSDVDILFFFLGPVGWVCSIVVGALWLGIVALEQASLTGIICAKTADKNLGPVGAIRFAFANAWPVIRVTARILVLTLLTAAPFLGLAAAVYFTLLTDYDINYYLKEKPPVLGLAAGIGVILMLALVVLLLRLFTGWFFALPLVLFEGVSPRDTLKSSARRSHGHRRTLLYWIVGWFLTTAALSALATGIVAVLGRSLLPGSTHSLRLLALAVGMTVLLWVVVSLAVNLLSTAALAAILYNLYWELGREGCADALRPDFVEQIADNSRFQRTRKQLVAGGIVAVVVAVAVGALALQSIRLEDEVTIMAHRGSSKAAPENTVAAIRKAIQDDADWVEIDVQETADGEVVVFHDSDFMKLARVNLKIWDATMRDLTDIDIGSWLAPEFKDERVPTLAKVLDECKGKIRVNIELKYYGHNVQLEQRVADIVESRNMASDVVVMSLKMDGVRKMKSIRPDWKVGLLMSASVGDLKKVEADFLAVNAAFADRKLIRSAHDTGKEVYVWTVNDAPTMSAMMSRGVDGLLTDNPAVARSVLEQRAQMSAPERLLLELAGMLGRVPEIGEQ